MGGLSEVGTELKHRRLGYSLSVVRDCVQYMQRSGYDLSILFSSIQSHYARAGWVIYPTYVLYLTPPDKLAAVPDRLIIEPCDPNRDLPALMKIYSHFNASRMGSVARTVEYWKNQLVWSDSEPTRFWVAKQDDTTVAYLALYRWEIREFGYLQNREAAATGLFSHLFHRAKAEGANKIEAIVPLEYRRTFEALGCTVRRRESTGKMIRIIDLASLVAKILPLLEARLRDSDLAGWEGTIGLGYEADGVTLWLKGSQIAISRPRENSTIDLVMSQEQSLKLLFGNMTGGQIVFSNNLRVNESEMNLLDVLFPRREFFMWAADRF
jgi:hypothetical protein